MNLYHVLDETTEYYNHVHITDENTNPVLNFPKSNFNRECLVFPLGYSKYAIKYFSCEYDSDGNISLLKGAYQSDFTYYENNKITYSPIVNLNFCDNGYHFFHPAFNEINDLYSKDSDGLCLPFLIELTAPFLVRKDKSLTSYFNIICPIDMTIRRFMENHPLGNDLHKQLMSYDMYHRLKRDDRRKLKISEIFTHPDIVDSDCDLKMLVPACVDKMYQIIVNQIFNTPSIVKKLTFIKDAK